MHCIHQRYINSKNYKENNRMKNTILSAVVLFGEGRKDSMGAGSEDMKMV